MLRRVNLFFSPTSGSSSASSSSSAARRAVFALGGNALTRAGERGTFDEMMSNAKVACKNIARARQEFGLQLVIAHGNGPQAGSAVLRGEIAEKQTQGKIPAMPLFANVAETQSLIGLTLQTCLEAELNNNNNNNEKNIKKKDEVVVTVGTRVRVDKNDPAFQNPTKPIGSFYTQEEKNKMIAEDPSKQFKEDKVRGGFRVVVPSPDPKEIVELEEISQLVEAGKIVISCGGGGIPSIRKEEHHHLVGVDAVIDKDLASCRLALDTNCEIFVVVTDVEAAFINFTDKEKRKRIEQATVSELNKFIEEKQFSAGSMLPKIQACARFVDQSKNKNATAIICSLENLVDALKGNAGTRIVKQQQQQQHEETLSSFASHSHSSSHSFTRFPYQDFKKIMTAEQDSYEDRTIIPCTSFSSSSSSSSASDKKEKEAEAEKPCEWRARNEWDRACRVFMHEPSTFSELAVAACLPSAALFETHFDPDLAAQDHRGLQKAFQRQGVEVLLLKDIIANKADQDPAFLNRLRNLAKATVELDLSLIKNPNDHVTHREATWGAIDSFSPHRVLQAIVLSPKIKPRPTALNTKLDASYKIRPLANLYFTRDTLITTSRGAVMSSMNSPQRAAEVRLASLCIECITGEPPLYAVTGEGKLEGGDFYSLSDKKMSLLGIGLRSNQAAADQLLENDVFGTERVVVVKDKFQSQLFMHLDTYFGICSDKTCVLLESRYNADPKSKYFVTCDIWEKSNGNGNGGGGGGEGEEEHRGAYRLVQKDLSFVELLHQNFENVIPLPDVEQLERYAVNFVATDNGKILLTKREEGPSDWYKSELKRCGVEFELVDLTNLTRGYGSAHCSTQVARVS